MKKLMLIALAMLVAPAMAAVTITIEETATPGIVALKYTVDGDQAGIVGSNVAGIALDVSVTAGSILAVDGYHTGQSTALGAGYGIFPGSIAIVDGAVVDDGSPVAAGLPDNPDQPGEGTQAIVLEFGALWDQRPEDAAKTPPLLSDVLCTIEVSESCTMTIGYNATRGKAVMLGGAAIDDADLVGAEADITVGTPPCYNGPDVAEWEAVGSPESWCNPRQCHGDADGAMEQIDKGTYWVGYDDINILLAGFKQAYAGDPLAQTWIAADFDHAMEQIDKGTYRVGYDDINILLGSFKQGTVADDCNQ